MDNGKSYIKRLKASSTSELDYTNLNMQVITTHQVLLTCCNLLNCMFVFNNHFFKRSNLIVACDWQ